MQALLAVGIALTVAAGPQTVQAPGQRPGSQPPARDTSADGRGTSVLRGRVVNTEGRPLRRVQIRLNGDAIPQGRTASTNTQGKWEIRDLPAGRFTLNATRAGYLNAQYGQKEFGEPGRPIDLDDGQTLENVDMTLTHNGAISGHVYDEAGEPLAGATVMPLQMRFFNGRKHLTPTRGTAITDDSGQYRIGGLNPGDYYVYAASRETWETEPPEVKTMGFMPTMDPAATTMSEAQRVRVKAGQEMTAIDIPLVPGLASKISGTAMNSQGVPLAGETVNLNIEIHGENFASFSGGSSTKVNPDGTFVFRNVAPGEYHLLARITPTDRPLESANVIVNAMGSDIDGVSIVTSGAGTVKGQVVIEPGGTFPTPLTRLFVRPLPAERETTTNFGSAADNGRVREDGTFELKQIVGASRLTIGPLPEGWAIRSIDQNGRDLAVQPLDPQGQTFENTTIVLTHHFPTVTAALRDATGASTLDGIFVLFPDDGGMWVDDLRMIRTGRPGRSGTVVLSAVRPGSYLAAAVPGATTSQLADPDYLESLRAQGRRVTINENEPAQIEVVVKAPER